MVAWFRRLLARLPQWCESVWQDLRDGTRTLGRSPAFTLTTLVTMVIGIALNTVQFSAFNATLLKPWPVENPDGLVLLGTQGQTGYRDRVFSLASPFDPLAFAGVAAILSLTGFLATLLPARRALSIDPAVTLRQDT